MSANPHTPATSPAPPLALGIAITGVIAFAVVSWIVLGDHVLKEPSYYAAFVLFWYWTTVQGSDFRRLPASLVGAFVGLGCTWALMAATGVWGVKLRSSERKAGSWVASSVPGWGSRALP